MTVGGWIRTQAYLKENIPGDWVRTCAILGEQIGANPEITKTALLAKFGISPSKKPKFWSGLNVNDY